MNITTENIRQRWHNPLNGRYYLAYVSKDLLDTWGVTVVWGGSTCKSGGQKTHPCESFEDALIKMDKIAKKRKQKNYIK